MTSILEWMDKYDRAPASDPNFASPLFSSEIINFNSAEIAH